ncbi:MAG: lamin tail domain-containing protein [Kiritimatiellae bacterium]|nr:lamin tail domain-containing protein [Kiritimatiellia bacterium]
MGRGRVILFLAVLLHGPAALAQIKINEVYYNVTNTPAANQFVELYNAGSSTQYLDGLILTDEADTGVEGVFQFPGSGTDYPIAPGAFVLIAVDADGTDGYPPDMSLADWECYAGAGDYDNPGVPNLVKVSGSVDLSLFPGGDNVILADGSDTSAPIDQATIIDGVNFNYGDGELAWLSAASSDTNAGVLAAHGYSIARCSDGQDSDLSSAADFSQQSITPGAANGCGSALPSLEIDDVVMMEPQGGTDNAVFTMTLSSAFAQTVTVTHATADGTAAAGSDYVAIPPTVTAFDPGIRTQTVTVTVLGDFDPEDDEVFYVRLTNPNKCSIAKAQGSCTLVEGGHEFVSCGRFAGGVITNVWTTISGKTYRIEYSTSIYTPAWTPLGGDIVATGLTTSRVDSATATQRMYRVLRLN